MGSACFVLFLVGFDGFVSVFLDVFRRVKWFLGNRARGI